MDTNKIITEYSPEYCRALELSFGSNMLSEGGAASIDAMFAGIDVSNKDLLEIGFGLGGAAIHLAEKWQARIKGIEVNPWLVTEAGKSIPTELKKLINFYQYENDIPFAVAEFDLVYSKGVFCHLKQKQPLLQEIYRVLCPEGRVVIVDWLSPTKDKWPSWIERMCEKENLTLYAETEAGYRSALLKAGFKNINFQNNNQDYVNYNRQLAKDFEQSKNGKEFAKRYGKRVLKDVIEGYNLIIDSLANNQILVRRITASKQ